MRCLTQKALSTLLLTLPCSLQAAPVCPDWVAKILSVKGKVHTQAYLDDNWQSVQVGDSVCPGALIRVAKLSRATLMLRNDAVLSIDQNTTLTLAEPDAKKIPPQWMIKLLDGFVFFRSRASQSISVQTPFINAIHEGTEFAVSVDKQQAKILVLDGEVKGRNDAGQIQIKKGYEGIALQNTPPRVQPLVVSPQDAVQWTLYYPPVLDMHGMSNPAMKKAAAAFRSGDNTAAIAALDGTPLNQNDASALLFKASLLLSVGRVDAVLPIIDKLSGLAEGRSSALALQAIIAVTKNQQQAALGYATEAVKLDPQSAAAQLALSYAQQSLFNIDAALLATQKATQLAPENALAWARLAELQLSSGDQKQALVSAENAQKHNPALARTQIVLGFAQLAHTDIAEARQSFVKAVSLDSADPLARLGLGLAKIRQGELVEGKQELETAVSLDPNNAVIRSYLGKAYYELKNTDFAAKEFEIAKAMDAKDPTPWLYDALLKLSTNRPVEALQDMQQSQALNDNRAVYRSSLLLDEDKAVRSANLGRIYNELGMDNVARLQANAALAADPSNYTAHRLMADGYMNRPRQEVARASEVLQAQLLQPLNYNPVQPQLAYTDLNIPKSAGFADTTFNEYSRLFEGNQHRFSATGLYGSNDTRADEAAVSGVHNKLAYSLGQMHYQTDGFRPNADLKHDLYNAFAQYEFSPQLSVQAEYRHRDTEQGDINMEGSANNFDITQRRNLNQETYRLGGKYSIAQFSDLLFSFIYADRQEQISSRQTFFLPPPNPPQIVKFDDSLNQRGYQLESQYLFHSKFFNIAAGGGIFLFDLKNSSHSPGRLPVDNYTNNQSFGYFYTDVNALKNVVATLGLAYDDYHINSASLKLNISQLSPKLGLQWQVNDKFAIRIAGFQTVKAPIAVNQSIQPMQIAGFSQFFDDLNGTRSTQYGVGFDYKPSDSLYAGIEAYNRELEAPVGKTILKREEELYRTYVHWLPQTYLQVNSEVRFESFHGQEKDIYKKVETAYFPLNFRFFNEVGFFFDLGGQFVHQSALATQQNLASFNSNFFVLDAALGYRFPQRYGMISLEARNFLDQEFKYRDRSYQMNEVRATDLIPERLLFARFTLNF